MEGNICRSPLAEAVFKSIAPSHFEVDSAGTASYHVGCAPDPRTLDILKQNGLETSHKAQQLKVEHFHHFDYILCMDRSNLQRVSGIQPKGSKAKVMLFGNYNPTKTEIEDPYYGDIDGFAVNYQQCIVNSKLFLQNIS